MRLKNRFYYLNTEGVLYGISWLFIRDCVCHNGSLFLFIAFWQTHFEGVGGAAIGFVQAKCRDIDNSFTRLGFFGRGFIGLASDTIFQKIIFKNMITSTTQTITFDDFMKVEMHVGTILAAVDFPRARKPAYQLTIDFGEKIGIKRSSAQITTLYTKEGLIGRQIIAVTNFPPRQIANFFSEVLVLGSVDREGVVTLLTPEQGVENGVRIA